MARKTIGEFHIGRFRQSVGQAAVAVLMLWVVTLSATAAGQVPMGTNQVRADLVQSQASLQANHIMYDSTRDRLYASVPPGQGAPGSIVTYFRDGRVGDPLTLDYNPNVLAISPDGDYLYIGLDAVGAVGRLNLNTMDLESAWSLGKDATCGRFVATDMVVVSDNPPVIAVARDNPCLSTHTGVALIEAGMMRPATTSPSRNNSAIELSPDPQVLIGFDRSLAVRDLRSLIIDDNGVVDTAPSGSTVSAGAYDIRTIGGRIFTTAGDVNDAVTLDKIGRFDVTNSSLPVIYNGRAFFLEHDPTLNGYELHIFDAQTFDFLGSTPIAGLEDDDPGRRVEFIAAGANSMGIRLGDGGVYWLKIRLVQFVSYLPYVPIGGG